MINIAASWLSPCLSHSSAVARHVPSAGDTLLLSLNVKLVRDVPLAGTRRYHHRTDHGTTSARLGTARGGLLFQCAGRNYDLPPPPPHAHPLGPWIPFFRFINLHITAAAPGWPGWPGRLSYSGSPSRISAPTYSALPTLQAARSESFRVLKRRDTRPARFLIPPEEHTCTRARRPRR